MKSYVLSCMLLSCSWGGLLSFQLLMRGLQQLHQFPPCSPAIVEEALYASHSTERFFKELNDNNEEKGGLGDATCSLQRSDAYFQQTNKLAPAFCWLWQQTSNQALLEEDFGLFLAMHPSLKGLASLASCASNFWIGPR